MKKSHLTFITIFIIGTIIAIFAFFSLFPKTIMNKSYVNGNTASNLYNGGTFCEYNGVIYFSNPDDYGKLYCMDSNLRNLTKLSEDIVTYINVDDNYIYYIRNNVHGELEYSFVAFHTNALVRINKDGRKVTILDTEPSLYAALLGNYIYYIHYDKKEASTLYKVRIDGEEQKQVMNSAVYTCNTDGQYFYYNGMNKDGSIHRYDTKEDTSISLYAGNTFQPVIVNSNDIYFVDGDSNNALVRTDLTFENFTYITNDDVDAYNVSDNMIYYQRYNKNGSALCMVSTEGGEETVIREGDYCNIHVTSSYVFFTEYHSQDVYYFAKNNPENVKKFSPGSIR